MYELITNVTNYTAFMTGDGHAITEQLHDLQVTAIIIIALLIILVAQGIDRKAHWRKEK